MSESVILKAFDGDRKKNLEAIATEFRKHLKDTLGFGQEYRRLVGYCDQLEIIADELEVK